MNIYSLFWEYYKQSLCDLHQILKNTMLFSFISYAIAGYYGPFKRSDHDAANTLYMDL